MSIQFDQEFFNNIKEKAEKKLANNDTSRFSVISNAESLSHSFLLSKLTFNLSKGHYYFVYEILKTKIEKLQIMGIEADPNEQASLNQPWLQAEKDQMSRKFLNGKSCLILCCYIKELEWSITLARLLIDKGALLTVKDATNGCYPLHYACALLRPELIELFIRRTDFEFDLLDMNLNSPLVYFMVSFSLYLNKMWSPVTNYKNSKKAILRKKLFDNQSNRKSTQNDDIESIIEESNDENLDINMDEYEMKLINALKVYLGHLKRFKIKVNSINRFGYSLLDINSYLTASNKSLENHLFFILIKKAAMKQNENIVTSSAIVEVEPESLKQQQQSVKQFKSSSYKSGSLIDSILNEAPPATIRIYLELILKKNLLINLNEMQFPRIIVHEKKVDKDLVFLFLEKQINDCRALTITKYVEPPKMETKEKTIKSDWRDKLSVCYHYLEMDQTKSLRKGVIPKSEPGENLVSILASLSKKLPQINEKNEQGQGRMSKVKR